MSMSKEHCQILKECRVELVRDLEPNDIVDYLIANDVLGSADLETIDSIKPRREKVRCLLNLLPRRGDRAFDSFLRALKDQDSGHRHLYDLVCGKLQECVQGSEELRHPVQTTEVKTEPSELGYPIATGKENRDPTVSAENPSSAGAGVAAPQGKTPQDVQSSQTTPVRSQSQRKRRPPPPPPQPQPELQRSNTSLPSFSAEPSASPRNDSRACLDQEKVHEVGDMDPGFKDLACGIDEPDVNSKNSEGSAAVKDVTANTQCSTTDKPTSDKSDERKRIKKEDIGPPTDFRHVAHVGHDPQKVFGVDDMDTEAKDRSWNIAKSEANTEATDASHQNSDVSEQDTTSANDIQPPAATSDTPTSDKDEEETSIKKKDINYAGDTEATSRVECDRLQKASAIDKMGSEAKDYISNSELPGADIKETDAAEKQDKRTAVTDLATSNTKPCCLTTEASTSDRKDERKRIKKEDIGPPTDFRHVTHVGSDPSKVFGVDQMDTEAKDRSWNIAESEANTEATDASDQNSDAEKQDTASGATDSSANILSPTPSSDTSTRGKEDDEKSIKKTDMGIEATSRVECDRLQKASAIDKTDAEAKDYISNTRETDAAKKQDEMTTVTDLATGKAQPCCPTVDVSTTENKDERRQITKEDIGYPEDFKHITHIDCDPEKGFGVDKMNPEAKEVIQSIGFIDANAVNTGAVCSKSDVEEKCEGINGSTDVAADDTQTPTSTTDTRTRKDEEKDIKGKEKDS